MPSCIRWRLLGIALACHLVAAVGGAAEPTAPQGEGLKLFESKIRPVLVAKCYACHSAEAARQGKLKADLALDSRSGWEKGGASGPAIIPGKAAASLLLQSLRHDGLEMPPGEKLSAEVVADFEQWISLGAPDPRSKAAAAGRRGLSLEEGRAFWSFKQPRPVAPPVVQRTDWPRDEVDRFILAAQEKQGFAPAADSAPHLLIRRLSLDLTGLLPPPHEVEAFVREASASPAAAETALAALVDRLLASPHFGERWARHWLDAVRYADSNGRDRNVYFYHAWRYRNYVIAALNADKPYDQFLREQLAGDLLPAATPAQRDEQLIATGFLALGAKAFEEQKPEIFRMDVIDEQLETLGRAVLGLSLGCARCHDHKFDPIPTVDYYALAGIFRSTEPLYGYGPKGIKANVHAHTSLHAVGPAAETLGPAGLAYLARLQELTLAQNTARSDRYRVVRIVAAKKLDLTKPGVDKPAIEAEIARLEADIKEWDVKVKAAETELQTAMDSAPPQPAWAMGARERPAPEDCRVHLRGDTANLGDPVPRGVLSVVDSCPPPAIDAQASGRRELAEWLTDPRHPLTARVQVNRIWLHLFGRGLVATPDDFGASGARPTHPELLDHLALRFVREGWSNKQLIRTLVLSRTYRQASASDFSAADPDNVWFCRQPPRRMEAEIFRDAVKTTAGTLNLAPPTPEREFLAQFNPYREDEYRTFKPLFEPAGLEGPHRSIYLPVIRGVLPPLFALFDFAAPERPVAQRSESILPAQALFLLNNPWIEAQAEAAADKLLENGSLATDAERITLLYRTAFGRPPRAEELRRAADYVAEPEQLLPGASPSGKSAAAIASPAKASPAPTPETLRRARWASFCQALWASAEFRTIP